MVDNNEVEYQACMANNKSFEEPEFQDYGYKQVIVMRNDLNMRKGKMIVQGCHASMKAALENLDTEEVMYWLKGKFAKIAVRADSLQELLQIKKDAEDAGLITALIIDDGRTEFDGVKTPTCIAVGPAKIEDIDKITGHLKLL